jgi:hypothetical protein
MSYDIKTIKYDGENTTSSTSVAEKTGHLHVENKLHPCLSPCKKLNSKWMKDLNRRPETLKLAQEKTETYRHKQ